MSRRVSNKKVIKGEVKPTNCNICEKNGENANVCSSHNFKDLKGRVVCDRFLKKMRDNQCYKCERFGHFPDHCACSSTTTTGMGFDFKKLMKFLDNTPREEEPKKKETSSKMSINAFAALNESSDEEEDDKPTANVTLRMKVINKSWTDWDSDEE
jgi:hypothetical protein